MALAYVSQRLRHYFLAHKLHLMVRTDPIRYLLSKPILFKISQMVFAIDRVGYHLRNANKNKRTSCDRRASLSSEGERPTIEEIPREMPKTACAASTLDLWSIFFYGSSTTMSKGARIALTNPDGHTTTISFQLTFVCTNNIVEYEALISGLVTAWSLGATKLRFLVIQNL